MQVWDSVHAKGSNNNLEISLLEQGQGSGKAESKTQKMDWEEGNVWTDSAANDTNPADQDGDQLLAFFFLPSSHSSIRATHLASANCTLDLC